jgi:hypothetical protein
MMLRKIYNNLPIVLLVLIVLSIPYLMYKGVNISPRVGYIKDCSGVPVPESLEKNKLDSYCDCVKNPNDFRRKEEKIVSCIDEAKPKPSLFDLFKG